jgi:hypothetical protein
MITIQSPPRVSFVSFVYFVFKCIFHISPLIASFNSLLTTHYSPFEPRFECPLLRRKNIRTAVPIPVLREKTYSNLWARGHPAPVAHQPRQLRVATLAPHCVRCSAGECRCESLKHYLWHNSHIDHLFPLEFVWTELNLELNLELPPPSNSTMTNCTLNTEHWTQTPFPFLSPL